MSYHLSLKDARIINTNSLALGIINKGLEDVLNRPARALFPSGEHTKLVDGLKRLVDEHELRRISLPVTIGSREIRMNISLLKVDDRAEGWVIAMEDMKQLAEQV